MKRLRPILYVGLIAAAFSGLHAQADPFDSTTESVGWKTNGFQTPVNQFLSPAGIQVQLPGVRPNALALSPDGKLLAVSGLKPELLVLDPGNGATLQTVAMPSSEQHSPASVSALILKPNLRDKLSYTGLTFSPDGRRIYLSSVNGDIKVFAVDGKCWVTPSHSISLPAANAPGRQEDIPTGLAVSPDGKLYVALNVANQLAELDTSDGKVLRSWDVGVAPFGVVLAKGKAYVSNWGGRRPDAQSLSGPIGRNGTVRVDGRSVAAEGSVSIIDLASPLPQAKVELLTGMHCCALALSPDEKFVVCANAGCDTLSVIDTAADRVIETVSAKLDPGDLFGAQPDALAFESRGRKLFVCNASQNAVAIFNFDPGHTTWAGLIPVGWFPGGIAYDAKHKTIDVANIIGVPQSKEKAPRDKAHGEGFNSKQWYGSLTLAPVLSGRDLKRATAAAVENLRYPLLKEAALPPRLHRLPQPVPERAGEPSVFEHVLYIGSSNKN